MQICRLFVARTPAAPPPPKNRTARLTFLLIFPRLPVIMVTLISVGMLCGGMIRIDMMRIGIDSDRH